MDIFARGAGARPAANVRPTRSTRPGRLSRWRRRVLRRVIAAVLLGAAAICVLRLSAPAVLPTTDVVVLTRDLPSGSIITDEMVTTRSLPAPVAGGALRDTSGAIGRRLAGPVGQGEALTPLRFVPRSLADGLEAGVVALHVEVVDPRSLDLVASGMRVSLHDLDGTLVAPRVLVLSIDTLPETGITLAPPRETAPGLVIALPRDLVPAILARKGIEAQRPTLHLVLDPVTN